MADDIKKLQFQSEWINCYTEQYMKLLNLDLIDNKSISNRLKNIDYKYFSQIMRIIRAAGAKTVNKYDPLSTIITCFKVSQNDTSCIYAYLYSNYNKKKIEHAYLCTGYTYNSQDGEYRYGFVTYFKYTQLLKEYSELFDILDTLVSERLGKGELSLQANFYYPNSAKFSQRKFEDSINVSRIAIYLYLISWIRYYNRLALGLENHINAHYVSIIHNDDDYQLYLDLLQNKQFYNILNNLSITTDLSSNLKREELDTRLNLTIGQKIIPLTIMEVIRPYDIRFSIWREIYINALAANLVLNLICPSFPFTGDKLYIQNTNMSMYDNFAIYEKYEQSKIGNSINKQLDAVDKLTYENNNRKGAHINSKFAKLSKHLVDGLIYVDNDIRLSDISLAILSEHTGYTVRDSIIRNSHYGECDYTTQHIFTDRELFYKHIFEYIYALYCANTKISVIHGDLHSNNATLYLLHKIYFKDGKTIVKNPKVVYLIGSTTYIFSYAGLVSTIIDFSRAIMGDYKRIEQEFSAGFAEMFFAEQRERLMDMLYHYFPTFMNKYYYNIQHLLVDSFPLMFKAISCIDVYVFMHNVHKAVSDSATPDKYHKDGVSLCVNIAVRAETLLLDGIRAIIEGKVKAVDDIEWPNLQLITDFFSEFIMTEEDTLSTEITIEDVYNSNNDIVYDIEDYENWGPLYSLENKKKIASKYGITIDSFTDWYTRDESIPESIIESQKSQVGDYIQFEPWMVL
jgi:hypothetical protein